MKITIWEIRNPNEDYSNVQDIRFRWKFNYKNAAIVGTIEYSSSQNCVRAAKHFATKYLGLLDSDIKITYDNRSNLDFLV